MEIGTKKPPGRSFDSERARLAAAKVNREAQRNYYERKKAGLPTRTEAMEQLRTYIYGVVGGGRKCIDALISIMEDPDASPGERIRAIETLLTYGIGKPTQEIEVSGHITLEALVLAANAASASQEALEAPKAPEHVLEAPEAVSAVPSPIVEAEPIVIVPDPNKRHHGKSMARNQRMRNKEGLRLDLLPDPAPPLAPGATLGDVVS